MAWKSWYHVSGTVAPVMALGLPSRLIIITILPCSSGCFFSHACEPTRPFSSAANAMKTIERFGFAPDAAIRRMASMPGANPDPSSTPPVALLNASKCPPMTMYSSGYVVPRSVATTLWYLIGPILNQLRMSNSRTTGSFLSDQRLDLVPLLVEQLDVGQHRQLVPRRRVAVERAEGRLGVVVRLERARAASSPGSCRARRRRSAPSSAAESARRRGTRASRRQLRAAAAVAPEAALARLPPMSTHAPLNAALFALISAMAACTAARFFSTFSFATGCAAGRAPGNRERIGLQDDDRARAGCPSCPP